MQMGKARKQLLDEINITPLTDVFLVLLIIMIIVAPLLKVTRNDIKPPQVDAGQPITKSLLVIEVTASGVYFIDGVQTPPDQLADAMAAKIGGYPEKNVAIRADRQAKGDAVLKIFDAAKEAKFDKMTVAVETLSNTRQQELQQQQMLPPVAGTAPQTSTQVQP